MMTCDVKRAIDILDEEVGWAGDLLPWVAVTLVGLGAV